MIQRLRAVPPPAAVRCASPLRDCSTRPADQLTGSGSGRALQPPASHLEPHAPPLCLNISMPTPDARGRAGMGNGQAPGTPSGSPFAAATAMEVSPLATSTAGTPPVTPSQRRKAGLLSPQSVFETAKLLPKGGGREGGGRGRARTLLYSAATVVMLMLVGMAASELNLRVSSTGVSFLGVWWLLERGDRWSVGC